jgi:predicted TIM-barrel fold metal-dependent hydrolase
MQLVDVHAHYGKWPFPIPERDVQGLLRLMDDADIEICLLSSALAIVYDMREGNRRLAEAIRPCHPRLRGYVTVNANYLTESCEEMDRYLDGDRFVGVKVHPSYQARSAASAENVRLVEEVAKSRRPLLIHTMGASAVSETLDLARRFPELPILFGHGGGDAWEQAAREASQMNNLYLEFCASHCEYLKVPEGVRLAGAHKIMFGSDLDLISPHFIRGMYDAAPLTEHQRSQVYRENAVQLFGLSGE